MTEATKVRGQRLAVGLVVLWVALILVLTMRPAPERYQPTTPGLCVVCGERGGADAVRNFLFFVPLGVFAAGAWRRTWLLLGAAALLPVLIETVQVFVPGRDPALGDVLFNALGAATGVACARAKRRLEKHSPAFSGWVAALLIAGVFAFTGLLVSPALPDSAYSGELTPVLERYSRYRGTVLEASLGPQVLAEGRIEDSDMARELLRRGELIRASVIAGRATHNVAPVVRIRDDQRREIFVLAVDRKDLVFRLRTRAQALALQDTDIRWVGGMRGVARRDTVRLEAWRGADGLCLRVDDRRQCGLGYTVGDGWRLILSSRLRPRWVHVTLTFAWLFGTLFAVGWWSKGATRTILAGAGLLALMFALPLGTALVSTPLLQGATALAGILAGLLARRLTLLYLTRVPGRPRLRE